MEIKSAQYMKNTITNLNNCVRVICTDDSELIVPMNEENRHYAEILKQVADGTLTIKDAE